MNLEPIIQEGTAKTPDIDFNSSTGKLVIKGRSIPENSIEFYKPIVDWLDAYSKFAEGNVDVVVQLEYFNTSSSKCILDVFKRLENINAKEGVEVLINWYYEEDDEDMLEAGEDYQSILKIPFKMVEFNAE